MVKSKNEIRERNGKFVVLVIFLLPVLVYFLFNTMKEMAYSFSKSIKERHEKIMLDKYVQKDTLPSFMLSKYALFVGSSMEEEKHIVQGLDFKPLDSFTVEYKYNKLVDWKTVEEKEGCASLLTENGRIKEYELSIDKDKQSPAYRLVDLDDACEFQIYISKVENPTSSRAKIFENCADEMIPITPLMYSK